MDTILLIIGVLGLSISGWVLRGYFLEMPKSSQPESNIGQDFESEQEESNQYVTKETHQHVLNRLAELEHSIQNTKVSETGTLPKSTGTEQTPTPIKVENQTETSQPEESLHSQKWQEIYALQEAFKAEREKEKSIDYEREQMLFDISQGYASNQSEVAIDQQLIENTLEEGEVLDDYQKRIQKLASLTNEMLTTRLEVADRQLREQGDQYQATLLAIIKSLINRIPGDSNVKSLIETRFEAESEATAGQENGPNKSIFHEMFYKNIGH
ncbi:hypothetical protein GO730_38600 [Spirosoma sp. HMF3257]|uniref:Uncharacterized protein n=1 Tax=Spirosoma telluris TaxID=2183553 RepID=A0A327NDJ1_9BACT|nr:hypothetical protein [Spirosoma telluris]RAI73015.1 hypothetical protein HMF3257_38520 [Spirosoma telluris]